MADKKIKVQVDVETNSDEAGGKVKNLKVQLREARIAFEQLQNSSKATADQLKKAADKIDDIADKIDKAKFSSGQFEDKIASLPGPLGKLGGGLKSVKDAFTVFGTSLTISLGIIGLLATAFFTIKNALGKTEEGTRSLAAVTSAFNKVLAPILAIFERLGTALLPIVTKGLEAVGSVMGKVAKFFGVSTAKITETTTSLEKNNEAAKTLAEAEEKRLKDLEDKKKLAAEAQKKRDEDAKKRREDKLAKDKEADSVEIEAFKATLTEREKSEYEAGVKLAEQRAKLEAAGRKDFTAIEEQYRITLAEIAKKYDEEEAKKKEEKDKKDKDDAEKKASDARALLTQEFEDKISLLDAENDRLDNDFQADLLRLEQKKSILAQEKEVALSNTKLTEAERLKIISDFAQREREVDKATTETKKAELETRQNLQLQYADVVGQLGSVLQQAAGDNKALAIAGLIIEQAAGVARIVIGTQAAAAKAGYLTPVGIATLAAGALGVVSAVLATKKGIEQIKSQQIPGGKGGSASTGGNVSAPTLPRVGGTSAPQIQTGGGLNPTQQIGETISRAQTPIRAYVVSGEISSQQALDRRTNRAATFAGG